MELRDHPLMAHGGISNWPPTWIATRTENRNGRVEGEVGTLKHALMDDSLGNKIFLVMQYNFQFYLACMDFDNALFCQELHERLQFYLGRPLEEIGSLDLS